MRNRRHDRPKTDHYFSPRTPMPERDYGIRFRLSLPTVAPGQICGGAPFRQLALHIPPYQDGRHRRHVSARKSPKHNATRRRVSQKLQRENRRSTKSFSHIQQAWMNSRNLFNIASAFTHRQPVILHHSLTGKTLAGVARNNRLFYTTGFPNHLERLAFLDRGAQLARLKEGAWEGCVVASTD
jgi:hypothetical protein